MGLFGSRKKTYVSSVVYNMAGDEFKRPDYLKSTVVTAILNSAPSMSEAITGSYLNGPGMRFRRFFKWADRTEYNDLIGLVTGEIRTGNTVDQDVVITQLPGSVETLESVVVGDADYSYWADQYVLDNYPDRVATDYSSDITLAQTEEEVDLITITWEDNTTEEFEPVNFDKTAQYMFVIYTTLVEGESVRKIFIYKYEDGNETLDEMFAPPVGMPGFYPVIPFRLDNEFLSTEYLPAIYKQAKKGYKKATTGRFDKLIEELEDNEDLKDIDYAYIVFGVCLNVLEQASRKYIYTFFKEIINDYGLIGESEHAEWEGSFEEAQAAQELWLAWNEAQSIPEDPLYGTPEPPRVSYPTQPVNSLKVSTKNNPTMNYDITIEWTSIVETSGSGLLKPDAERDELWFEKGESTTYGQETWGQVGYEDPVDPEDPEEVPVPRFGRIPLAESQSNTITLNWQVDERNWKKLTIRGLKHRNLIYGGKAVEIDAWEALDDGEESGFIIPLHDGVFRQLGLVDGTQMTTACSFMVFNCYTVVKKKWYQTGLFVIVLIIIIVVVAFFTGGAALGASGGILGTNAGVGTAILGAGASATAAAVVGAVANAIAAILLTQLITAGATAIFGEKVGAIIGAIASVIALNVGSAMAGGQSMSSAFGNLMRAENIMTLTSAVGQGYAGYMQAATADLMRQQQELMATYEAESREIRAAWEQNLGHGNGIIDPVMVTSAFGVTMEEVNSFLQRTLMTGSDVADMSLDMLSDFVRLTISTELPT